MLLQENRLIRIKRDGHGGGGCGSGLEIFAFLLFLVIIDFYKLCESVPHAQLIPS